MNSSNDAIYSRLDEERSLQSEQSEDFMNEKIQRPRSTSKLVVTMKVLAGLLVATVLATLFNINYKIELVARRQSKQRLINSPIPELPEEVKVFEASELYMSRPNEESNLAWEALAGPIVKQQGFITVKDSSQYGIPPGAEFHGHEVYGISMYHQLHCLAGIRKVVWALLDDTLDREEFFALDGNSTSPDFVPTGHGLWHMNHCFNYVRQGLQCAGDMSLERPTFFNGEPIVVGWGNAHTCKSWDAAWQYIEEHPAWP